MKIKTLILVVFTTLTLTGGLMMPSVYATNPSCSASGNSNVVCRNNPDLNTVTKNVLKGLFAIIGALSVIVIIASGIIYATSAGDQGRITMAKQALFGAVIGLIISILAYAIVNFIVDKF